MLASSYIRPKMQSKYLKLSFLWFFQSSPQLEEKVQGTTSKFITFSGKFYKFDHSNTFVQVIAAKIEGGKAVILSDSSISNTIGNW